MTIISASKIIYKHSSDDQTYALDFTKPLFGRTLSSVDSIAVSPAGLTASNQSINSSKYTDDDTGLDVAANKAVQFDLSGGTDGSDYTITITCTTSDSKTLVGVMTVAVRDS